uniref:Uncharacterized protein n=1 Tax=Macrostomum lignano TaxID=282301 RepID=A0A1I8FG16_9PLAT
MSTRLRCRSPPFFNRAFELSHIEEAERGVTEQPERSRKSRAAAVRLNASTGKKRLNQPAASDRGSHSDRHAETCRRRIPCKIQFSAPLASLLRQQSRENPLPGRHRLRCQPSANRRCSRRRCRSPRNELSARGGLRLIAKPQSTCLQVELRSADRRAASQQSMSGGSGGGGVQLSVPPPCVRCSSAAASRSTLAAPPASSIASDPVILMMGLGAGPRESGWRRSPTATAFCYDMRDFNRTLSRIQNVVWLVMLSQARSSWLLSGQFRDPQLAGARGRPAARLAARRPAEAKNHSRHPGRRPPKLPDLIKPLTLCSAPTTAATLRSPAANAQAREHRAVGFLHDALVGSENGHLPGVGQGPPHRPVGAQAEFRHSLEHARHQPSRGPWFDSFFSAADLHAMMSCIFSDGQRLDWRLSRLPSLAFLALLLPCGFWPSWARCCYCGSRPNIQFVRLGGLCAARRHAAGWVLSFRWRAYNFHKEEVSSRSELPCRQQICQEPAGNRQMPSDRPHQADRCLASQIHFSIRQPPLTFPEIKGAAQQAGRLGGKRLPQ